MSSLLAVAPPGRPGPDAVGTPSPTSPRRREHVPQPPVLTTALSTGRYQGSGLVSTSLTPSTTLSSPFSQTNPSPGGALRGTSPMASRQSGGYAAAYNPQEWGPVAASPQVGAAPFAQIQQRGGQLRQQHQQHQQQRSDEPAAPPPYSPRRQDPSSRAGPSAVVSPAEAMSPGPSQQNTPISATATASVPTDLAYASQQARSRPASMIYGAESTATSWPSVLPPPPPPMNRAVRSSSSTAVGRRDDSVIMSPVVSRGKQVAQPAAGDPTTSTFRNPSDIPYFGGQANTIESVMVPPSSKRAVSTSAIGMGGVSSRTSSRSESISPARQTIWEPGMPLPGPPPGPPPSSSRSQSAGGASETISRHLLPSAARPKIRQAPQTGTCLGPVPPTPAGWTENTGRDADSATDSARAGGSLTFSGETTSAATPSSSSSHSEVPSTFFRANAKRDLSTKGIRERRSESRSARENHVYAMNAADPSTNPWADAMGNVMPANLTLPTGGSGLCRTRTITKLTPRTPRSSRSATLDEQLPSASSRGSQTNGAPGSSRTTPRPESGRPQVSPDGPISTPPFSPGESPVARLVDKSSTDVPPKALPTPPPQQAGSPTSLLIPPSGLQVRPISHILHMPNEVTGITAPLSPRRLQSTRSDTTRTTHPDHDTFIRDCLDRTRTFLEKEQNAQSDVDRLQLFADYILAESRIRRRRYAPAFSSFDPRQTRDRLFELNLHASQPSSGLQETTVTSPVRPPSPCSLNDSSQPHAALRRPDQGRPDSMWWSGYQPALSPIASMSMNDEQSSRGRAPSRWWESQTGSDSGGGARRVERSKRESKYMGLPLREVQLAIEGEDLTEPGPSQVIYGPDEYPREKVGWHENEASTTPAMPPPLPSPHAAVDVSRLVTLPPPYPRHYPAVQNQHPDLLSYRTLVRTVSDYAELASRRARYTSSIEALQKESLSRVTENRRNFRINIQAQIQEGSISYAEAAEAEAAMKSEEHAAEKTRVQAEFDSFQDVILNPLHDLLNDRISKTTCHIDELRGKLLSDAQLHNPDQTQSAGDERPELLEQLTQLKWLFEAREQLHKEVFNLLTERNAKYQAIVTLPYQQSVNKEDKIRETVAFFTRDSRDRTVAFEKDVLRRHEHFLSVVEENVLRGVEAQLSAFWDIAPGLLAICQKIPDRHSLDTDGGGGVAQVKQGQEPWSGIQIPRDEVQENPSYRQFPMQYLYSLLVHAERSTYQLIESQINLLCLLHEARTGVMGARIRCWEAVRAAEEGEASTAGADEGILEEINHEARERRQREERALTADLKDRVATVEGQWTEALGSAIVGTRERVRGWLVDEGGWDKELLEDVE